MRLQSLAAAADSIRHFGSGRLRIAVMANLATAITYLTHAGSLA
jgi:hypothetical protein